MSEMPLYRYHQTIPRQSAGEVSRKEKMLYSETDPESFITEYTLVYEDNRSLQRLWRRRLPFETMSLQGGLILGDPFKGSYVVRYQESLN